MLNLLTEQVIEAETKTKAGRIRMSLPETYAACIMDQVEDFPHIRDFQRHPWHALLTQMGAIAMINGGITNPPKSAPEWEALLLALTEDQYPSQEPWHMVVDDITMPAFLQPPASDRKLGKSYKGPITTPDSMDLTVGSKNHDVKHGRMTNPHTDQWLFALTSRQTAGGYDGNRLQRISRMNQGYGNRHAFCITPSIRWGPHLDRDLRVLAGIHRGKDVSQLLLWTRTWDGQTGESIKLDDIEPNSLYVEVSRRIRLCTDEHGRIMAQRATSKETRIEETRDGEELCGKVGDPWTLTQEDKSATVSAAGFSCEQTSRYLDPESHTLPLLCRHHPSVDGAEPMYLVAQALSRGQGRTEGYHELIIPMTSTMAAMLDGGNHQHRLAEAVNARRKIVGEVQKILANAYAAYISARATGSGGSRTLSPGQKRARTEWRQELEHLVGEDFWTEIQKELEEADPAATTGVTKWTQENLIPKAVKVLRRAQERTQTGHHTRFAAITRSDDIFFGSLRNNKGIPQYPPKERSNTDE